MNILSEIINPIVEFTVQACEAAVKALVDATVAAALAFHEAFSLASKELIKLASKIISPRVVFLAAHAKKNRVRKKNTQRILKAIQKLGGKQ